MAETEHLLSDPFESEHDEKEEHEYSDSDDTDFPIPADQLDFTTYDIDSSLLASSLESVVSLLAKEFALRKGDIVIRIFGGITMTFQLLLAAGNKAMDALLYHAFHNDSTMSAVFEVQTKGNISQKMATSNYVTGSGVIKAWVVFMVTRGSHPNPSSTGQMLPPFMLKQGLVDKRCKTESDLVERSTSMTSLEHIPGQIVFNLDLTAFGQILYQRMMLTTAGTRALKYAKIAASCTVTGTMTDLNRICFDLAMMTIKSSDHWKIYHPMNQDTKVDGFTAMLTNSIYHAIVPTDRGAFIKKILDPKYKSFHRDPMFVSTDVNGQKVYEKLEEGLSGTDLRNLVVIMVRRAEMSLVPDAEVTALIRLIVPSYRFGMAQSGQLSL